jgi:hypothetical protein
MTERHWGIAAVVFVVAMCVCGIFGVTMSIRQSTSFHDACIEAGGTVHSYDPRTCVGDGRIIQP